MSSWRGNTEYSRCTIFEETEHIRRTLIRELESICFHFLPIITQQWSRLQDTGSQEIRWQDHRSRVWPRPDKSEDKRMDTSTCFYCKSPDAELCPDCGLVAICSNMKHLELHRWELSILTTSVDSVAQAPGPVSALYYWEPRSEGECDCSCPRHSPFRDHHHRQTGHHRTFWRHAARVPWVLQGSVRWWI